MEKKGWHGHSLREKVGDRAQTPAWTGFYCFSGYITSGWSSFTMHRFAVGDYLLQITKERMLLIQREGCCRSRGKVVELVTLILGRFSTDFRKLL